MSRVSATYFASELIEQVRQRAFAVHWILIFPPLGVPLS